MEDLPQIVSTEQQPVTIQLPRHWYDHCFQGRAVLPAVEAMQLLAHRVGQRQPRTSCLALHAARFEKFLELPADHANTEALCRFTRLADGTLRAALMSRIQAKSVKITRTIVHAQVDFPGTADGPVPSFPARFEQGFKVAPRTIYEQLVPFGAAYRNIARDLILTRAGAVADLQAPDLSDGQTRQPLGSPFVLDAAFHAACVWGQRYADVVAFPVGFEKRLISKVTLPGHRYTGHVIPVHQDGRELVFDIRIVDAAGDLSEMVSGVRMRDVSGGRVKPPAWIKADSTAI